MNIIVDFNGVVFAWTPEAIITSTALDPAFHDQVRAGLFAQEDWLLLDRGTLARDAAIARAARHTGWSESVVASVIPLIPNALVPMTDMVALLQQLKAQGHLLYYLTNINEDCIVHLETTCSFWHLFSGGIASCRVHALKPEGAIYSALLDTYALAGTDMLFIDDRAENLEAATAFGMQTVHFQSPAQCTAALHEKGIMP